MKVVIDRFEDEMAVVEIKKGVYADIPRTLLPEAVEGDVIDICVNKTETEKRRSKAEALRKSLYE